jgi:hypothetical protein
MRLFWMAGLLCGLLASPLLAASVFSDGFESGVSGSKWEAVPGVTSVQILVGDSAHALGSGAAKQVNADPWVYYMRSTTGQFSVPTIGAGEKVVAKCMFWDDNTIYDQGNPQRGGGLLIGSYQGNGVLNDFYQLLVNSTQATGGNGARYLIRSSLNGYADSGVSRSQGWHEFRIEVLPYTGSNDVAFYIDNNFVGNRSRRPGSGSGFAIDDVRLGLSIKSPGLAFWYDNVDVSQVPEPATLTLLGLGALLVCRRRRA